MFLYKQATKQKSEKEQKGLFGVFSCFFSSSPMVFV